MSDKKNESPVDNAALVEGTKKFITKDFLAELSDSPRLTIALVGKVFHVGVPERKTSVATKKKYVLMHLFMEYTPIVWYAKHFFKQVVYEGEPIAALYRKGKVVSSFKGIDFEPSVNHFGDNVYSSELFDLNKLREREPEMMRKYRSTDPENKWTLQREANEFLYANAVAYARDVYVKDGKLTEEAIERHRLGKLIIGEVVYADQE